MGIDAKKVYDKIRSLSKAKCQDDDNVLQSIPKETVDDKMSRMYNDDIVSTTSVPASTKAFSRISDNRRIFSEEQIDIIMKQCSSMLKIGSFSKKGIIEQMSKTTKGKAIIEEFDVEQIRTRLKYEKLKKSRNPTTQ